MKEVLIKWKKVGNLKLFVIFKKVLLKSLVDFFLYIKIVKFLAIILRVIVRVYIILRESSDENGKGLERIQRN